MATRDSEVSESAWRRDSQFHYHGLSDEMESRWFSRTPFGLHELGRRLFNHWRVACSVESRTGHQRCLRTGDDISRRYASVGPASVRGSARASTQAEQAGAERSVARN